MADDTKTDQSLRGYVSDMIAFEKHCILPLETQSGDTDFQTYPEAASIISRIHSVLKSHVAALEPVLEQLGGHPASGVKETISSLAGAVAGGINKTRRNKVSRGLRDDSVALSEVAISYTMLHATALGMRNNQVAAMAEAHLNDVTPLVVEISRTIPNVVVRELAAEGLDVDTSVGSQATSNTQAAWNNN